MNKKNNNLVGAPLDYRIEEGLTSRTLRRSFGFYICSLPGFASSPTDERR